MAPCSVLFKRNVYIEHEASETRGELLISDESGSVGGVPTRQDIADSILAYLRILKPDAHFANPLELSSLRILRPTESIPGLCADIHSAFIMSADRNLVALYAGPYHAGANLKGGYLIYDATKNSLSTIPQPPYDYYRGEIRVGAIVVCLEEGEEDAYLLAELTRIKDSDPSEAALCSWQSSSAEWTMKVASFPPELSPPNYFFLADMCFSYRVSILCWVDGAKAW